MSIIDTEVMRGVELLRRTHDVDLAIATLRSQNDARERNAAAKRERWKMQIVTSMIVIGLYAAFIGGIYLLVRF